MWTPFAPSSKTAGATGISGTTAQPVPTHPGPYPWHHVSAARLRDGALVTVRPIHADDRERECRFLDTLSVQTRYRRLMSTRKLLPGELDRLVNIDYRRELALVALGDAAGEGRGAASDEGAVSRVDTGDDSVPAEFAAVARYVRDAADPSQAEMAIVVADAWQGRGLGEVLLRRLVTAARAVGLARLTGSTLSDNMALLGLVRKLGFRTWREPGDATVTQLGLALREARPSLDTIDERLMLAELHGRA